jgi:hypothetical protein
MERYGATCKTGSGHAGENPVAIGDPALKLTTFLDLWESVDSKNISGNPFGPVNFSILFLRPRLAGA